MEKCREVIITWRLVFRQIHNEKAEKDRKDRGLKASDLTEPDMPREFRSDEDEERTLSLALLANAAQAALQTEKYAVVESRASQLLELEPDNKKAFYRRGLARLASENIDGAKNDFWSLLRVSGFESKEALSQLMKLMPKEEVQVKFKKLKAEFDKKNRLGSMLQELDEDERIAVQEERYQRFLGDCEQRAEEGQRELTFDEWAKQYEWRYDADERMKMRKAYPECFNAAGAAPLPIESWEVDYLTHKEIEKIVYRRQTEAMGARRRQREGTTEGASNPEVPTNQLILDREDEKILKDAVVKKGYNYWW